MASSIWATLSTSILVALWSAATVDADNRDKPNILFIMVDDLGKEWVGCYGADDIATSNIDRLAKSGMRFNNAYCMPQCTPTRVTFLTGQYPFRHGWVNHWDVPRWGGGCSFDPQMNPSIGKMMKAAGYRTACAGKWQIDDFRQEPTAMVDAGFDQYCMWTGYETGNDPSGKRYWDPYIFSNGESKTHSSRFGPDVFTDFLIEFIKQNKREPMFLYFPMVLTHGPLVHTPRDPRVSTKMDKHRAMVRYTDEILGRLLKALDDEGVRENTIVIWTTDNGTSRGIAGSILGREIQGGKAQTTENGICVPFIASCPGRIPSGVVSEALIDFTDMLPTFVDLAQAQVPAGQTVDGQSFKDVLLGHSKASKREWILAMGGRNEAKLTDGGVENKYWYRDRVLRDEEYKLFVGIDGRPERFVHLSSDPTEQTNLLPSSDPHIRKVIEKFMRAVESMPDRDNDPRYEPLPHRPWFREPNERSQVWKVGYPG